MIKECKYCNKNIEDLPGYKKGAHIRNCKVIKLKLIKKNQQKQKVIKKQILSELKI